MAEKAPTFHFPQLDELKNSKDKNYSKRNYLRYLVDSLVKSKGNFISSSDLSKNISVDDEYLINFAKKQNHIFEVKETSIALRPKFKICVDNQLKKKCTFENCRALHLCYFDIFGNCPFDNKCYRGHNLKTKHNNNVLKYFGFNHIGMKKTLSWIKKSSSGSITPMICGYYAKGNCDKNICFGLHFCPNFLSNNGECHDNDCVFNHDIFDPQCDSIFKMYGIDTNCSSQALINCIYKKSKGNTLKSKERGKFSQQRNKTNLKPNKKHFNNRNRKNKNDKRDSTSDEQSSDDNYSTDDVDSSSICSERVNNKQQNIDKFRKRSQVSNNKSILQEQRRPKFFDHYYFNCNVEKEGICVDSIDRNCTKAYKCPFLHSKTPYWWQFSSNGFWINFRYLHNQTLEKNFENPNFDYIELSPLLDKENDDSTRRCMQILGKEPLFVNYEAMLMNSSDLSFMTPVRRLSTKSFAESFTKYSCKYNWYFKDQNNAWILYGMAATACEKGMVPKINCLDIEKAYISGNKHLHFSNDRFDYTIDFESMTQRNLQTLKIRKVCRRQSGYLEDDDVNAKEITSINTSYPSNWVMSQNDKYDLLVAVDNNSQESNQIKREILLTYPNCPIQEIKRVQNTHLWKKFKNKLQEIGEKSLRTNLNIQRLYYPTSHDHYTSICSNNVDRRLHLNYLGEDHGKGACFTNK